MDIYAHKQEVQQSPSKYINMLKMFTIKCRIITKKYTGTYHAYNITVNMRWVVGRIADYHSV